MIKKIEKYDWLLVIGLFILAEILINPIGEFTLNDDWAYAKAVSEYVNTGNVNFSFWQAIPDLPQFFVGIIACKLFGFSFTALRFISISSIVVVLYVLNIILKETNVKPKLRLIFLLVFAFNPLTISLSNTFLPDILQLLLTLISFWFIIKYLKNMRLNYLIGVIFFSILATLNRQTAIIIPFIFGIICFTICNKDKRKLFIFFLPFIINFIAILLYEWIAKSIDKIPGNYNLQLNNIIEALAHPSANRFNAFGYYLITSSICLGLCILPLTISNFRGHFNQMKKSLVLKSIFSIYFLLLIFKVIYSGNVFPFVGNMFYQLGVGPIILTGFNTDIGVELTVISKTVWIILNFAGGISFFISMSTIVKKSMDFVSLFFVLLFVFYLFPICVNYANDRYLLYLLPFYFLAYILSVDFILKKLLFMIILIPLIYFSVATTHDYLSINRAKMEATNHLTKDNKILPNSIDGGFEFNGWHSNGTNNYIPSHKGRWWWIENDDYIITPFLIKGYVIESEYSFSSWISFGFNKILVLKRATAF